MLLQGRVYWICHLVTLLSEQSDVKLEMGESSVGKWRMALPCERERHSHLYYYSPVDWLTEKSSVGHGEKRNEE